MGDKNILRLWSAAVQDSGNRIDIPSGGALHLIPSVNDQGVLNIGNNTTDMDVKVWLGGDGSYVEFNNGAKSVILSGVTMAAGNTALTDNELITFGTGSDFTLGFDATQLEILPVTDDTGAVNIGDGTTDADFKVFLGTTAAYLECNVGEGQVNIEGAELHLGDNDLLEFGDATGGDFTIGFDATQLEILPTTDDTGAVNIGDGTTDADFKVFLGTTSAYLECNVGDGQINIEGAELHLGDNDLLEFGDATAGDFTIGFDATQLEILPTTDDTGAVNIGDGTTDADFKVFLGTTGEYFECNVGDSQVNIEGVPLHLGDNDLIEFGDATAGDFTIGFDATQLEILPTTDDTGAVNIGDGTTDADFKVFLGTTSAYLECNVGDGQINIEGAALHLGDNDLVEFGDATAGDITLGWNATNLVFLPATDDTGAVVIGDGSTPKDVDFKVFLGATGSYFECERGEGQVNIEGAELHLGDDDKLEFGDGAGGDVTIDWNSAQLNILALADDEIIKFGNGTNSFDIWQYGNTANDYLLWDASESTLTAKGNVRLDLYALPKRYGLRWIAGQRGKPSINADILHATESTRMIVDPDLEVIGTNATSALSTFSTAGGITLTTGAISGDQMILRPHLDTSQSAWAQVNWPTGKELVWECDFTTGASVATSCIIWAGLKLTDTPTIATDNDSVFFRYEAGVSSGNWVTNYSIANADTSADSGVAVGASTRYHLKIVIDSSRLAKMYINGVLKATSTALTSTNLIPFVGIQTATTAARALTVHGQAISRIAGA